MRVVPSGEQKTAWQAGLEHLVIPLAFLTAISLFTGVFFGIYPRAAPHGTTNHRSLASEGL